MLSSKIRAKLDKGEKVEVVVVGDSIARGDDAPTPSLGFVSLWADGLHKRYGCQVQVTNHSYGGYTIRDAYQALKRIRSLSDHDLVVIAVGVNDAASRMPPRKFGRMLRRAANHALNRGLDVLLVTPLRPANADVDPYAAALRDTGLPIADVTAVWRSGLLANGINHPNADGHLLYADVLLAQFAPASVFVPDRALP